VRIDLSTRLTVVTYFCLGALGAEVVGGLLGLPVNEGIAATLGTVLLGTFGVGIFGGKGAEDGGDGGPQKP
jgi:hypothetical protein